MIDAASRFISALGLPMRAADVVADGTPQRFRGEHDKPGTRLRFYVLTLNPIPHGFAGSFSGGDVSFGEILKRVRSTGANGASFAQASGPCGKQSSTSSIKSGLKFEPRRIAFWGWRSRQTRSIRTLYAGTSSQQVK